MRILFTTDGSSASRHAVREAMRLLPLHAADNYVLTVAPSEAEPSTRGAAEDLSDVRSLFEAAQIAFTPLLRFGEPVAEICAAAELIEADLVVMGAHGRNGLERLVLGSVSTGVSEAHHGAVMVVRR
ncbi:MAG TPA: universal stress protein [Oscillatoriaceae cyanobacterium]